MSGGDFTIYPEAYGVADEFSSTITMTLPPLPAKPRRARGGLFAWLRHRRVEKARAIRERHRQQRRHDRLWHEYVYAEDYATARRAMTRIMGEAR